MIIGLWDRSGTIKSVITSEISQQFARCDYILAVIDPDLAYPTLSARVGGMPRKRGLNKSRSPPILLFPCAFK